MKAIDKVTTAFIGFISSVALLATLIMLVGMIGVIFRVYNADFFLSNVAIFKTLTIDRFIMLLVFLMWSALVSLFGIMSLRKNQNNHQFKPFYSVTVLLGVLPFLTTFLYVLFSNQCLWFSIMIVWVGILYFIVNRIIVIISSYNSIIGFYQSFLRQSGIIRVLEISTILLAFISVALPFID